jgi:hypothetical protein
MNEKDLKGSGCGPIEIPFLYFFGATAEKYCHVFMARGNQ